MNTAPQTPEDALTLALVLAINAPDEDRSERALSIAIGIAETMSARAVNQCKRRAERLAAEARSVVA